MTTGAQLLVDRALEASAVPPEIDEIARLHLLDAIGVGLAAAVVGPVRELPERMPAVLGSCTLLGSRRRRDAATAALVNGTLIHSIEFDDTHTGSVMHGSSVLAPAVLAAAEETGADGDRVLRAFVIGWETIIRMGLAAPSGFQSSGFQGTSVAGAVAAALAVGIIHGLDRTALIHALGIGASFSAGNFSFLSEGASVKAAQPGIAAQGAITAVRLARGGVTGASAVFDGPKGLFATYARDEAAAERFAELVQSLGTRWLLADAAFKEFPCCHFIHPFIEAVGRLVPPDADVREIERIHCRVPAGQESIIAVPWERKQRPATAGEGRWSLPYALAVRLVRGAVGVADFDGAPDAEAIALAERITWEPWPDSPYPERFPADVEVQWRSGTREEMRIDDVNGNRTRPWGAAEVVAKFRNNAALAALHGPEQTRISEAVLDATPLDFHFLSTVDSLSGRE